MVQDIRNVPAEQYWEQLRSMMGSDGLMTYWYLGRTVNTLDDPDTMRLRRDMRNPAGGIMAAPLSIAAPDTGGFTDKETVPAPVVYSLRVLDDARDVEQIRIVHSVVRAGRTMGFGQTDIVDAADPDRVIAVATGVGVKIGEAPPGFQPIDLPPDIPDSSDLPPLHEAFGARRRAPGEWELPELDAKMASTSASLHLGPIHVVLEAAAVDVVSATVGTDRLQVEDWQVMFVAPGTVGPFVATGQAIAGRLGSVACRLTLRDEGKGGRVVSSALATFKVVE